MNNLYESSELDQNNVSINASLHNQILQGDSHIAVSQDPVLECVLQQWNIKPEVYLPLNPDLKPDLSFKYDVPTATVDPLYIKEDKGL